MNRRLAKLQERNATLFDEQEATLNLADEEGRDLTDEESSQYDTNKAEMAKNKAAIEREQEHAEYKRTQAPVISGPDVDGGDRGIATLGSSGTYKVKAAFEADPKKGFQSPREYLLAVMDAGRRGGTRDERLQFLATAGSDEHGTYADPYGGFFVPVGLLPGFLTMAPEADPIGSRVTQVPMTTPSLKINARVDKDHSSSVSGGLRVYRRAETQSVTASRMVTEQVALEATTLMGVSYETEELLTDSAVSFVALLEQGFRDEFTSKLIDERLNGTGVGMFMGAMISPCLLSVAAETQQPADTIIYENLIKMRARCWRYSEAVWLYNHDALPQLMQLFIAVGAGGVPAWQTNAREGEPDTILGRPAYPTEYCQTIGDKGDILLGVWSQYLEGTLQGLNSAESLHVRFLEHERTFKFWMRNAGSPWWKTYLTPKNSTTTLSPFVTLAERA